MEVKRDRQEVNPGTLDVVSWKGNEYQLIGQGRQVTGKNIYLIQDPETEEIIRVEGRFKPAKVSKDPKSPSKVIHADEGVRNTGQIIGKEMI